MLYDAAKIIATGIAKRELLLKKQRELVERQAFLSEEKVAIQEALAYAQAVAQQTQETVKISIEDTVNTAIDAVFGDRYKFQLNFVMRRNRTEADIVLLENGYEIDPLSGTGGGVCDVLAFALRVVLLMISGGRRVLFLDEPMKNVSQDKKPIAFDIMKRLSTDANIQIIGVSHDPLVLDIADKLWYTTINDGVSSVKGA